MTIMRATLPEEFYDITSAALLVQPEPQYLHAQLAKLALGASLDMSSGGLGLPGRLVGAQGAPYSSVESDRFQFSDPIYSEAVHVVTELGRKPGHTIRMNRPSFASTTYTQASREVPAGTSISTTPVDLSSEQVAITLKRFAGPYSSSASAVAPYGVDRFDATMSIHSLAAMVGKNLKQDFDKFLDATMVALFDSVDTANIIRPTGFTANDDSTVAGDAPMDFNVLARVESTLDTANIPVFANGRRACVLHPRQIQQLKDDAQFARYVEYHKDVNPIFKSYVGTCGNLDIFKSTTLTTASNSSSVTLYYGQAFGPGKVGLGMSRMPEVVPSTSDNYGEQALVIWLTYAGFVNLDNRFGCSIRTS